MKALIRMIMFGIGTIISLVTMFIVGTINPLLIIPSAAIMYLCFHQFMKVVDEVVEPEETEK